MDSSIYIEEMETIYFLFWLYVAGVVLRQRKSGENTLLYFKQKSKEKLFNYSPWSINTPEERKLFTMVNTIKESCSLCRSQ